MLFGRHVNKYYLKYLIPIILGISFLLLVDWAQLELPEYYSQIVDGLTDKTLTKETVVKVMQGFALIALLMFIGRFCWRYFVNGTSVKIESDIREEMFKHSESLSQRYFVNHKTGALMALFTNDLSTVKNCLGGGTVMLVDAIFLGTLSFIKMIRLNVYLTIFSCIPMALIALMLGLMRKKMEKKWNDKEKAFENLSDFTQESFSGISVIKAFVRERAQFKEFCRHNQNNVDKTIDAERFATKIFVTIDAFIFLIFVIIIGGGAYLVYLSKTSMPDLGFTIGDLTKFMAYFDAIIWPMFAISRLINMRAQATASLKRISALLDEEIEIKDDCDAICNHEFKGEIEFKNLDFTYPESHYGLDEGGTGFAFEDSNDEKEDHAEELTPPCKALEGISFKLNAGESLGIIGRTGCGKTTLVDILLRIYNIEENKVFIDGIDIMKLNIKDLRNAIGYVPQDNFLFSDTISNNIGFAYKDIDKENVEKYAKLSDVHNNIVEFPNQYETVLGERGVTISGGQKQRISIARALIKEPQILILDDSVSAVDTKTEEIILSNLKEIQKNRTTILIAHRISTVKNLDKILVMDDAKVIGFGTHDELMEKCPQYQEMVRLQLLEEEVKGGDFQ